MPRPSIAIDVLGAQHILDKIKPDQFTNELSLCTFAAEEYNRIVGTPIINNQLIKLRINSGVLNLPFPMPKGKRGRQPGAILSAEHKEKLLNGRKTHNNKVVANQSKEWADNMKNAFSKKKTLLNGILAGKLRACVKGNCIECMGGDVRTPEDPAISKAIRDCRGVSCVMYIVRPYQKDSAEE